MFGALRHVDWWTACAALACYGVTVILALVAGLALGETSPAATVIAPVVVAAIGATGLVFLWQSLDKARGNRGEKSAIGLSALLIAFDLISALAL